MTDANKYWTKVFTNIIIVMHYYSKVFYFVAQGNYAMTLGLAISDISQTTPSIFHDTLKKWSISQINNEGTACSILFPDGNLVNLFNLDKVF